jgi:hypothetical protein
MSEIFASVTRHRFRFRLRSLLLLIAAMAFPVAWVSEQAREQREAATEIDWLYGEVGYSRPTEWSVCSAIQAVIAQLLGDDFAYRVADVWLNVDNTDDFKALNRLPSITSAAVEGRKLNGPLLIDIISRMPKLTELVVFEDHSLTPADILYVRRAPKLRKLGLVFDNDRICEEFVCEAARLGNLRSLELTCPRLTDIMVAHLSKATQMREILISPRYQNAPAQVQLLKTALPHCKVYEQQARMF